MSWYSKIYTWVREYRANHKVLGFILTLCLNILLILQILGMFLTQYVYVTITIGYYVQYKEQALAYLLVSTTLFIMAFWSLLKTIYTSPARVPASYRPPKELQDQLTACTPFINNRYDVDKSTNMQVGEQRSILEEMCRTLNVKVAECDQIGRIKYCYECGHLKPDRTRHCSSCGKCSVKYDHHCPWINTCVTHSNYKYFLLYVIYTTIFIYWFLLTSVEGVVRYFIWQYWLDDLPKILIYTFTFICGAVFGYYPLGELLLFHWQLVSLNETTVEQTKPAVLRNDNLADYNMGKSANFRHVFGWGLWPFPIESKESDGLHFDIRYCVLERNQFIKTSLIQSESEGNERTPEGS